MPKATDSSVKSKAVRGFFWRLAERCGSQLVLFVVTIILARILDPEVYGVVALVMVIVSILDCFINCGMGNALVQKHDADDLDFSSMFFFNIGMSIVLYAIVFFAAPFIADFYAMPDLCPVIRVLSLVFLVSGVRNIQDAYVTRTMQFKRFFFATLAGTVVAGIAGIAMALAGFGVWALVAQTLISQIVNTIVLWLTVKWRPKAMFSWQRIGGLFSYGWKLLVSSLLDTVYNNLQQLIIGKLYTASDLAFYNKGNTFPSMFINNIDSAINSVLFPSMSSVQDDRQRVRSMTRRAIKTSTVVIMPLMVGLGVCAEPLVVLLLTEKWLPVVPFMRVFCFTYAFYPIHTANLNAIKALGRSDLFLILEVIKKIVGLAVLFSTMWWGVMVMACGLLPVSVLSQIINSWPNKKLLDYSYLQQLKDIAPAIGMACLMGAIIFPITLIPMPDIAIVLLQFFIGAAIYVGGCRLFKIEAFMYLVDMAKPVLHNKFGKKQEGEAAQDAD